MPYLAPFMKVTWGGTFDGEEEIWTNGLNFPIGDGVEADPQVVLDATITNVAATIQAWHTNSDTGISNRCRLEWIKYATIGTDGRYIGDAAIYDYPAPVNGGSPGSIETQRSLCLSFKTAERRGAGANGRIFVPAFRLGVATNGRLGTSDQADFLAAGRTFILNMNTEIQPGLPGSAVSVMSNVGSGSEHEVLRVRVGDVIDSQRRRKNKMLENYIENTV